VNWRDQCAVLIPCLNEAGTIGPLVDSVREYLPNVLVLDDGSTDGTSNLAETAGALVLRHERPCGKGAALRTGMSHLAQHGFAWALLMDGDGQHAPSDIPRFLEAAGSTGASLVIGNRMRTRAQMPWIRWHVNRWMSARLSRMAGIELPDSQCGYRLVRLAAWRNAHLATTHYEIESEMLLAFAEAGQSIEFVPVQVIYKGERTKIAPLKDTWRWCSWWWGWKGNRRR
jgi:glycosyltransferase involved in cell wall biosynthesis